jgi:hypothetical protein
MQHKFPAISLLTCFLSTSIMFVWNGGELYEIHQINYEQQYGQTSVFETNFSRKTRETGLELHKSLGYEIVTLTFVE